MSVASSAPVSPEPEPEPEPEREGEPDPDEAASAAQGRLPQAEVDRIRRRARIGAFILAARSVVLQLSVFFGGIVLARTLKVADFGVFAIVQFALSFFTFFGDCGVGGALIRQPHAPTRRELSSVFFFQIAMSFGLFVLIAVAASGLRLVWSGLPAAAPWVMRALAADLLLTALRIVPSILLERELEFGKLAALEIVVQLSFYVVAVTLALLGWGLWALVLGVLAQGVLGAIGGLVLKPFWPDLVFDWPLLKPILRFGLTYQVKNVVSFINGAITPLYAGAMLGARQLGLVNWARDTAWYPLKLVEILARVNYPVYARLHGDRAVFVATLERSIRVCAFGTMLSVGFFTGMGKSIVHVIYTDQWEPALPYLYVYAGAIVLGFLSPIVGAALDASGRPGIIARLAVGWTALNWIAVAVTTPRWGAMGFVAGFVVHVFVGNAAVVYVLRRLFPEVAVVRPILIGVPGSLLVALLGHYYIAPWAMDLPRLIVSIPACAALFVVAHAAFDPRGTRDLFDFLKRAPSAA